VLLVDETWARRFFPDGSAVGRRLRQGGCTVPSCDPWTVIGVVEDVRYTGLADAGEGTVYMNFQRWTGLTGFLVVQTKTARPEALIPTIRRTLKDQEPGAPVTELVTGRELLSRSLREPRYLGFLVAAFAALALVLALVGVYGIMTYFVQQHRREIGIRLALGGRPSSVAGLVLGSGMKLAVAGTVLGVALGLGLSGYLESLLFRVEPADPAVFAGVGGLLVAVAVAACWGPAWRAGTVNPVETLREE
jgi:ABC-type antimicrobial peptide transport system permease subunit